MPTFSPHYDGNIGIGNSSPSLTLANSYDNNTVYMNAANIGN